MPIKESWRMKASRNGGFRGYSGWEVHRIRAMSQGEDLPDIISLRKGVNGVVLRRRIFPISGCHQAPLTSKPSPFTRSNLAASTGFEFIKRPNAAKPPRSAGLRVPNRLARHLGWAPTGLSPDTFPLPNSFRGPS
ncbi:hypothetical protein Droror1_Dr00002995 [Drosera rotundifolia]